MPKRLDLLRYVVPILLVLFLEPTHTNGFVAKPATMTLSFPIWNRLPSRRASSTALLGIDNSSSSPDEAALPKKKKKSLAVTIWVHVISIYIMVNYFRKASCWPAFFATKIALPVWSFIHALSGMVFAGSILTTTLLEWMVASSSTSRPVQDFWFQNVPRVEKRLVLPALTGSIVSGVAQAFLTYDTLRFAPRHVKSSLHLLLLFGIWWGVTDRRTQGQAQQALKEDDSSLDTVIRQRKISNIVSCGFLVALYAVMVLKPGYTAVV